MSADENETAQKALLSLGGKWPTYAAMGTFLLYLFGYLALRFQLSAYGVGTDLDVLDEKYLFAGSRFLVYLVSAATSVLLILFVPALLIYAAYQLLGLSTKERVRAWSAKWARRPQAVSLIGIVLTLLLVQLVLRKCFTLGNLLLADRLPPYEWIDSVLLTKDSLRSLYFTGLVAGILLAGGILLLTLQATVSRTRLADLFLTLQFFLFLVALLLLPVNYGVLISTQELPRVLEVGNDKLAADEQAWLVWENKDVLTYLIRGASDKRVLMTIPRKDHSVKIVAYDSIFQVLFVGGKPSLSSAASGDTQ